jgi:hypothetical protein
MKSPAKCAAWLMPIFLLTGCIHLPFHRNPPPLILAPSQPTQIIDLAVIELPPSEQLIPGKPLYNMRVREIVNPPVRHRRVAPPQEVAVTPEVAPPPTPVVSIIGPLTSGDPVNYRDSTEQSIASIERGVNSINRGLSDSDQKTADQIREFLKEARTALASGDVDGAHTLASKAQVLLNELIK